MLIINYNNEYLKNKKYAQIKFLKSFNWRNNFFERKLTRIRNENEKQALFYFSCTLLFLLKKSRQKTLLFNKIIEEALHVFFFSILNNLIKFLLTLLIRGLNIIRYILIK